MLSESITTAVQRALPNAASKELLAAERGRFVPLEKSLTWRHFHWWRTEQPTFPTETQSLKDSKDTAQTRTSTLPRPAFWCQDLLAPSSFPQIPVSSPPTGCPLTHQVGGSANQKATALSFSVPKTPLTAPGMPSLSSWHNPKRVPKLHWMGDHHRKGKMYRELLQNRS